MTRTLWMAIITALLIGQTALPVGVRAESPSAPAPAPPAAPADVPPGATSPTEPTKVDKRITQLHAALQITPDEEVQWREFADVMRNNTRERNRSQQQREAQFANLNAMENMESFVQVAREHAEELQRLATAFQALYAAMPDEQKKVADQVLRNIAAKRALE
jgi:protein CpxP